MLNITENSVDGQVDRERYPILKDVEGRVSGNVLKRFLMISLALLVIIMLLPWTQNIRARGEVTTLNPEQRPQTIHSVIPGRIEKWFVQEGDFVNKGDTILYLSEIKDEYFNPNLLENTQQQVKAKELAVDSYMEKIKRLDNQIDALTETARLKLKQNENKIVQAQLKVTADSIDYQAARTNYQIAVNRLERMQEMEAEGLRSLTDLESRELEVQKTQAEMISYESKLLSSRNELINARVELTSVQAQYKDDIAKAESNKYEALSAMYDTEATVTKLQNQYANYSVRSGLYYILAPQDGYITQAIQTGLGETIKEGEEIVSIMPSNYQLAVAMYVRPIDLPLLDKGNKVRLQFDGWPAVIFSGWPNASFGTYGGEVFAIDNFISKNGMYRVLVAQDPTDHPWPDALRVGAGSTSMTMLNDVPIGYELWRQVNGFPPDFYKQDNETDVLKQDKGK